MAGLTVGTGIAGAQTAGPADVDVSDLSGSGTPDDPYVVTTAAELQAMEDDRGAHYALGNDIDASDTAQWDGGAGFDPVGPEEATPFTGTLDGNGHTISGLTIDRPDTNTVGLFGYIDGGEVRALTLTDATVTGQQNVGAVAGESAGATIESVSVSATVDGTDQVGGVVGTSSGPITTVTVDGTVTGNDNVGGLVGLNSHDSPITDADAASTVTAANITGGLAGYNLATIENVSATGDVDGRESVGGLVGINAQPAAEIRNADASGDVNGTTDVGGLVGVNGPTELDGDARIQNASAVGSVTGQIRVGGLAGVNSGTIQEGTASGAVTGENVVGGAVDRTETSSMGRV